jgi:hypothetical protein
LLVLILPRTHFGNASVNQWFQRLHRFFPWNTEGLQRFSSP